MADDHVGRKCSYCGDPAVYTERVGSCRLSVCDESDCNRQFDEDFKEASRASDEYAREEAEHDNYDRYR